jgi:hypothetical protein
MRTVPSSEPEATSSKEEEGVEEEEAFDDDDDVGGGASFPLPLALPPLPKKQQQVKGAVCPLVFLGSAR